MTLQIKGAIRVFKLLCVLEFDTDRKRMSVIVVDSYGRRRLLSKGADSSMLPILESTRNNNEKKTLLDTTEKHLHDFASDGLRTLVLAEREISDEEWKEWWPRYKRSIVAVENREDEISQRCDEIERDLELVGVTAVEDKLQDQVPETLSKFANAGIKVWVLTGDKKETALNIGFSCGMLSDGMEQLEIEAEQFEEVKDQILEADRKISDDPTVLASRTQPCRTFGNWFLSLLAGGYNDESTERSSKFALIVTGHGLYHALTSELEQLFLNVACRCSVVICCRVAPLQKGKVVDLVKRKKGAVTLAVGDGGNDVNMIKTANIGVGIKGKEGRQAVLASDFALGQFRFLQRLLFVHGRIAYSRVAIFMNLFFYKTFVMTFCHIWFGIYNGWSAQTMFDAWYILCFNLFYTSTPVFYLAVFDRDVNDSLSLRFPKLYTPGITSNFFNWRNFLIAQIEGIYSSAVIFWCIKHGFSAFSEHTTGSCILQSKSTAGIAIGTIVVVIVTLRCYMDTRIWTPLQLTPFVSIGFAFLFQWIIAIAIANTGVDFESFLLAPVVWQSPNFWLCLVIACTISLLPIYMLRFLQFIFWPTLSNKAQVLQIYEKRYGQQGNLTLGTSQTGQNRNGHLAEVNSAFQNDVSGWM